MESVLCHRTEHVNGSRDHFQVVHFGQIHLIPGSRKDYSEHLPFSGLPPSQRQDDSPLLKALELSIKQLTDIGLDKCFVKDRLNPAHTLMGNIEMGSYAGKGYKRHEHATLVHPVAHYSSTSRMPCGLRITRTRAPIGPCESVNLPIERRGQGKGVNLRERSGNVR